MEDIVSPKFSFEDSAVDLDWLLEALGMVFLTFAALETGLKFECFAKVILGILNGTREEGTPGAACKKVGLSLQ